jgi:quercetin dioxygenase-like cupin family protein
MSDCNPQKAIFLKQGKGRNYDMGRIKANFKADGQETANQYSVSEWWMEPNTKGIGAHSHDDGNEIFYVLEGTMSFLVGEKWQEAEKGSFIYVPAGIQHDFENRSNKKAVVLNIFAPGTFEEKMPKIIEWFKVNPPSNAV